MVEKQKPNKVNCLQVRQLVQREGLKWKTFSPPLSVDRDTGLEGREREQVKYFPCDKVKAGSHRW